MRNRTSTVIDAGSFTTEGRTRLLALAQSFSEDKDSDAGAPAPDAYKSHSGGSIDVLNDTKEKAEGELSELRKAEGNAKQSFDMLEQSLESQVGADTEDMDDEKAAQSSC